MASDFGYGKIILLGEHFVVYGLPALVTALDLKTYAQVREYNLNKLIFIDNRPKAPGYCPTKKIEFDQLLENILSFSGVTQRNLEVTFSGSLPVTCGGIGSSAAVATSFARAINSKFNLGLSDEQINQMAFVGEKAVHGTPSGIDNTAATFGGVIKFYKQNLYSKLNIKKSVEIVIVDSGKRTNTKRVIADVKSFLDKNPEKSRELFSKYESIFTQGINSLENEDLKLLGHCMNENHRLLQELGVSCTELDFIVQRARLLGAWGAKLTGTGQGGLSVFLTPERALQESVAEYFKKAGYFVIKTQINA